MHVGLSEILFGLLALVATSGIAICWVLLARVSKEVGSGWNLAAPIVFGRYKKFLVAYFVLVAIGVALMVSLAILTRQPPGP